MIALEKASYSFLLKKKVFLYNESHRYTKACTIFVLKQILSCTWISHSYQNSCLITHSPHISGRLCILQPHAPPSYLCYRLPPLLRLLVHSSSLSLLAYQDPSFLFDLCPWHDWQQYPLHASPLVQLLIFGRFFRPRLTQFLCSISNRQVWVLSFDPWTILRAKPEGSKWWSLGSIRIFFFSLFPFSSPLGGM